MRGIRAWLLALVSLGVTATPELAAQARLGFYGGLALSSFGGRDLAEGWHTRRGALGGGFIVFPMGRVFSLRPGVAWVEKGGETSAGDVTGRLAIQYFEIAALAQVAIPSTGWIEAHGILGPVVGLEMKCEFSAWSQYQSASAECRSSVFQGAFPTKSRDVGLLLGAGATLAPRHRLSFLTEVAYELGLTSIVASTESLDIKNRSFGLRAGLLFSL
jgi:hypothetical protein